MQLKASTDYGLRIVLYLAHEGSLCSSRDIAREMSIPRDYLIQLAQLLRNAGIIAARPGKHGGYRLAKDPAKITLLDVMTALDEEARPIVRARGSERREAPMLERVRRAYLLALDAHDAYLGTITIEALLERSEGDDAGMPEGACSGVCEGAQGVMPTQSPTPTRDLAAASAFPN